MYQYDLRMAYVTFQSAADFFDVQGGPNRIEVVLHDRHDAGAFSDAYAARSDGDQVSIRSWDEMNAALLSALELERIAMFLVLGFIVLVASFNIVGSLVMIIMEKAREISILRAMGSSANWMGQVFLIVGAFIGFVGIGTGLLLGVGSCIWLTEWGVDMPREYYVEKMPVDVVPGTLVAVILVAALLVLLSTLIPARRVRKLAPSEGLRHE
jgi:lipoprotein-releasing system permease protein